MIRYIKTKVDEVSSHQRETVTHSEKNFSRLSCPDQRHLQLLSHIIFSRMFVEYTALKTEKETPCNAKGRFVYCLGKKVREKRSHA